MLQNLIYSINFFDKNNFINVLQKKWGNDHPMKKKEKQIAFGKSCATCHSSLGRGDSPTFATPLLSKFTTSRL
jgi:hypothetical protein